MMNITTDCITFTKYDKQSSWKKYIYKLKDKRI